MSFSPTIHIQTLIQILWSHDRNCPLYKDPSSVICWQFAGSAYTAIALTRTWFVRYGSHQTRCHRNYSCPYKDIQCFTWLNLLKWIILLFNYNIVAHKTVLHYSHADIQYLCTLCLINGVIQTRKSCFTVMHFRRSLI